MSGPRCFARPEGVLLPGSWTVCGGADWYVADRVTGRNLVPDMLDPLLPEGSRFRGRRRVTAAQAQMLARIANDPDGTQDMRDALAMALRRAM